MNFEEKLIKLRKQKALSQEELAQKLDVTRQTISKWELGQAKPDMDNLIKLSEIFNISVDDLTNEKNETITKKNEGNKNKKIIILAVAVLLLFVLIGSVFAIEKMKALNNYRQDINNYRQEFNSKKENVLEQIQSIQEETKQAEKDFEKTKKNQAEKVNEINREQKTIEEKANEVSKDVKSVIDRVNEKLLK